MSNQFARDLSFAIEREALKVVKRKGVQHKCPHCGKLIAIKDGSNTCPYCCNSINATIR